MIYRLIHLDYVQHIATEALEVVGEWAVYPIDADIPPELVAISMTACDGLLAKWRPYYAPVEYVPQPKPIPEPLPEPEAP